MRIKIAFAVNVVLTCATLMVMLLSCGGCTQEQVKNAADVITPIHQSVDMAAPVMQQQPWYVLVMLAADIASSVVAGLLAYMKKKEAANVEASKN
jgi:glycerol uptake facilitator-like aquaporin